MLFCSPENVTIHSSRSVSSVLRLLSIIYSSNVFALTSLSQPRHVILQTNTASASNNFTSDFRVTYHSRIHPTVSLDIAIFQYTSIYTSKHQAYSITYHVISYSTVLLGSNPIGFSDGKGCFPSGSSLRVYMWHSLSIQLSFQFFYCETSIRLTLPFFLESTYIPEDFLNFTVK